MDFLTILAKLLRGLFLLFDKLIYGLISAVYGIMMELSKIRVFGESSNGDSLIAQLGNNIYVLLGIIMLFKLAISFLKYIVNPDDLDKKGAGGAGLIKQIVLVMALILLVPILFKEAYNIQDILLEENVVEILAFGNKDIVSDGEVDNSVGDDVATSIFSGFVQPNNDISEISSACSDSKNTFAHLETTCLNALEAQSNDSASQQAFASGGTFYSWMYDGKHSISNLFDSKAINAVSTSGDSFVINYSFFLSTIVGAVFLYVLVLTCIDIAKRSVMLGFLELIAPIPIIYSLQPGDDKLKKWAEKVGSTFISLFVRLATFFLAIRVFIYVIHNLDDLGITSFWTYIFLIFGVFFFMKELPGMLSKLFNFNGGGAFSVNPKKGIGQARGIGRGAAGLAAGTALGAGTAWEASRAVGRGSIRSGLSAVRGAVKGGLGGAANGAKAKSFKDTFSGAYTNAGKNAQGIYDNQGKSASERFKTKFGMTGGDGAYLKERAAQDKLYQEHGPSIKAAQDARGGKAAASDYNNLIKNSNMRDAIANMSNAKMARNEAQSAYSKMQSAAQNGEKVNLDELDKLRINAGKAESVYSNAKGDYDKLAKIYTADAESFSMYSAGEDRTKYSNLGSNPGNGGSNSSGNTPPSSNSSSSQSSGGTSSGTSGGTASSGGTSTSGTSQSSNSGNNGGGQTTTYDGRTYHQNGSGIWMP